MRYLKHFFNFLSTRDGAAWSFGYQVGFTALFIIMGNWSFIISGIFAILEHSRWKALCSTAQWEVKDE